MENPVTKIAKNTVFLYVRTIALMLIAIYTSRVLLDKLGVEEYGVYNLVGGVVGLFGSLRNVFAQAVQRFLNFERGKGNEDNVRNIFSISIIVHVLLATVFTVVVWVFGVWYIPRFLVFPDGMLPTAMFVFYCSLLTAFISILTVPYDSAIIANERFDFYAIVSILDALARLGIIYLLTSFGPNKLKTYAILMLVVVALFRIVHIIYTFRFRECKLKRVWDKEIFKSLVSFSGWNFLGNTAYTMTNEGVNFVINVFGGVVANAARGLAYQVKNAVTQLSANVALAFRPYVTEASATKNKESIFGYAIEVSRLMFVAVVLAALPIICYTDEILDLWLVDVPELTAVFVQIVLIQMVIRAPQASIDMLFASYDRMKKYQIVQSVGLFTSLPLSYLLLRMGLPLYWAFISMCVSELITLIAIVVCAHQVLGFSIPEYLKHFVLPTVVSIVQLIILGFIFNRFLIPKSVVLLLFYTALLLAVGLLDIYFLYFNTKERAMVKRLIKK